MLYQQFNAGRKPFVIAELSGNHGGRLERALELVDAAAAAGATAAKIQTFTADSMTLPIREREFLISNKESLWYGRSLYEVYDAAHTPRDWHGPIFERCRQKGILGFSTPFDEDAVDFLDHLGVPLFKIASFECVDLGLIARAAKTGKPLVISTGMATHEEIGEAVEAARSAGCKSLTLLKCTSSYPAPPAESNLRAIPAMREAFGVEVGLSDHTIGVATAVAAVAMGATVIEKHLTIDRNDGAVDSKFSATPDELQRLVSECGVAFEALGQPVFGPSAAEQVARTRRRSIYVVRDVPAGQSLTRENLRKIRPGLGLPPKHLDAVLGRKAKRDIPAGTPLRWEDLQ